MSFVSVIFLQSVELAFFLEFLFGVADALGGAVFDEGLGGLGDEGAAVVRESGSAMDGNASADAVTEKNEIADAKMAADRGKENCCFAFDEIEWLLARVGIGLAEAEAVISDDGAAGGGAEMVGEIAPEFDAAEGVMEEEYGGGAGVGMPDSGEEAALGSGDLDVMRVREVVHSWDGSRSA